MTDMMDMIADDVEQRARELAENIIRARGFVLAYEEPLELIKCALQAERDRALEHNATLLREAVYLLARFSRMGQHPDDKISVDVAIDEASDIQSARCLVDAIRELNSKF